MKKNLLLLAGASSILFVSGCSLFWKPKEASSASGGDAQDPVVVKIDGKPVLRKAEFLEFAEQAMKANPYLSSFGITSYETAPEPIRQQLLDAVVQQKLVARWGEAQGIQNTAEYKQTYAKILEQLSQALMAQTFDKEIFDTITVNDEEIAEKYENMREEMIKEPSVVKAVGVSFASEEKAQDFYERVAVKEENSFVQLAKDCKVEPVAFEALALDPRKKAPEGVPAAVKRALVDLGQDQYYAQAKDGNVYWVLQVLDRTAPVYAPFEEVAEQLSSMVKHEKFKIVRDARVQEIRSKHTVDIDQSVLGTSQEDPFAALQAMLAAQGGMNPQMLEELAAAELEGEEGICPVDAEEPAGNDSPAVTASL